MNDPRIPQPPPGEPPPPNQPAPADQSPTTPSRPNPATQPDPAPPADADRTTPAQAHETVVALVERDRYCPRCGTNLRQQPVRRHLKTNLLLVRCQNCAHTLPAESPAGRVSVFQQRVLMLILGGWVIFLPLLVIIALFGIAGITLALLDTPNGTRLYAAIVAGAAAVHFTWSALLAVACHHWRRPLALRFMLPLALFPHSLVCFISAREHYAASTAISAAFFALSVAAVIAVPLGQYLGRPLARLLVRAVLPPAHRARFAWLWTADKLPPPAKQ